MDAVVEPRGQPRTSVSGDRVVDTGIDLESWVTALPLEGAAEVLADAQRRIKPVFRP